MSGLPLPLAGVRILDLSTVWAIPYAMGLLADLGAEVIKIEPWTRLAQDRRLVGPFPDGDPGERFWDRSGTFNTIHRGKKSLTLDLNNPSGISILKELIAVSDVLAENFTPRVMQKFGLEYRVLQGINPELIMLSNTGFGHTGPWADYGTIGIILELLSGLTHLTGYPDGPPMRAGMAYSDFPVAWMAAFAVMVALHQRAQTGRGQWIDLSMYQTDVSLIPEAIMDYTFNGRVQGRMGNRHPSMAPHGCYPCAGEDQWVVLAVEDDIQWRALCRLMGRGDLAEDERYTDALARYRNQGTLDAAVAVWTRTLPKEEAMHRLQAEGIAAGAVHDARDLFLDSHLQSRSFFEMVPHPLETHLGKRPHIGRAWKLSKTPTHIRKAAPLLGEDNRWVLQDLLGHGEDDVAGLEDAGVIAFGPPAGTARPQAQQAAQQVRNGQAAYYDPDYRRVLGIDDTAPQLNR